MQMVSNRVREHCKNQEFLREGTSLLNKEMFLSNHGRVSSEQKKRASRLIPSRSLTGTAPEKLPKPNRKGWSSNQPSFFRDELLNFGRVIFSYVTNARVTQQDLSNIEQILSPLVLGRLYSI